MNHATETQIVEGITSSLPPLVGRLNDLFRHHHWGNMGPELYRNGGAKKFEDLLTSKYTPYAGEQHLFDTNADEIVSWAGDLETAVIIGPGPAKSVRAKELRILQSMTNLKKVVVIELSPEFNQQSTNAIQSSLPHVEITSFLSDFRDVELSPESFKPALVISTGSFTNFEDMPSEHFPHAQVKDHLLKMRHLAGDHGKFLWGYDSSMNEAQYNGPQVSAFILHPLEKAARLKQYINLDPNGFKHESKAISTSSCLSHFWIVTQDQDIRIGEETYALSRGEQFTAFSSAKLTPEKLERTAAPLKMNTDFVLKDKTGSVIHGFSCSL